jgi:MYXO-CTERM domain-containing protein
MTRLDQLRPRLLAGLAVLLVVIGAPAIALAHADYERAEPAADAVVTTPPPQVQIWFTQELFRRQGMNRIEVYDAAGQRVDQDDPTVDDDNRRLMTVSLQPNLADGVYTVRWYSLSSEDGHEGEGEFTFTVASAGTEPAADVVTTTTGATTTVTATEAVTATVEPAPIVEPSPTAEPALAATTAPGATADAQAAGPQCFGVAVPLALALGAVLVRRRRDW